MALNIRLGVSTWLWTSPFSTKGADELFSKIKKCGYDKVEIAVEDPDLIDVKELKAALANTGLEAIVCGAFGESRDLTSDDNLLAKTGLGYIEECLELSAELDTGFFAGPMYSAVGKARMVSAEQRKIEW